VVDLSAAAAHRHHIRNDLAITTISLYSDGSARDQTAAKRWQLIVLKERQVTAVPEIRAVCRKYRAHYNSRESQPEICLHKQGLRNLRTNGRLYAELTSVR